jgi:hypothetical protein
MLRTLLVATVTSLAAAGCYAGTAEPVGYAQVTSAPPDIETYPMTQYEGRPVYLYRDHWYYRDGSGWSYYQTEPAPLQEEHRRVRARSPAQERRPDVETEADKKRNDAARRERERDDQIRRDREDRHDR